MIRDTSLGAYEKLHKSGEITERQKEVYEWLEQYGPCTARELHQHVIEDENVTEAALEGPNYVKPRLTELKDEGLVKERGKRECGVTGIRVYVLETA